MKNRLVALLAAGVLVGAAAQSRAITFAEIGVNTPGGSPVPYTYTNSSATFSSGPSQPVQFQFDIPTALGTLSPVSALLTLTSLNGGAGFTPVPNAGQQIQNAAFTFTVTLNQVVGGFGPGTLLLTGTSTFGAQIDFPSNISGQFSSDNSTYNLAMTSPFVSIDPTKNEASVWSYSTISPSGSGHPTTGTDGVHLEDYLFNGNGNFSAVSVVSATPEPGSLALLLGSGTVGSVLFLRRRRSA